MRRLARVLLDVLTALSLLMCIAAVVLWPRSFVVNDVWQWVRAESAQEVGVAWAHSDAGAVSLGMSEMTLFAGEGESSYADRVRALGAWQRLPREDAGDWRDNLIPRADGERTGGGRARTFTTRRLRLPFGLIMIASVVLPITRLAARRRRQRAANGHCPACGYDLRASPGRCPECGAAPAGAT
jgi:hypothetical protein